MNVPLAPGSTVASIAALSRLPSPSSMDWKLASAAFS
jgi:hypothetical protein